MIGFLHGTVLSKSDPHILIDVHGVGYKVHAAQDVLQKFHKEDEIRIFTHTHVREDLLELYGFIDEQSLALFEQLISVNGIGPKTAIGVFAIGKKEEILKALRSANVEFFTGVPRLGRKNAQKLIIELKNKLGTVEDIDLEEADVDVINALIGFGFSSEEARKAVHAIGDTSKTAAEKIKLALRYLGK